jgi:endonuclease/exonuclease/phosphatase family metal-dependent hydrolase
MQPNGAWGWNIGDGKYRLDYLPSRLQKINDGKWHEIAVSFYMDKQTAWLYFDGRHVAIYSLKELNLTKDAITKTVAFSETKTFKLKNEAAGTFSQTTEQITNNFNLNGDKNTAHYVQKKPEKFTVMAWNIWHGARHNGTDLGIEQAISAIRTSGASLVCMQETYGSGPRIADALGTLFYYRSSNLSVHSKYPIVDTYDLYQPFRFGGVRIKMGEQLLDVFSLWIHYLPSISKLYPKESIQKILEEENKTRGTEIKDILASLKEVAINGEQVPLIVGGDFNSPSHLDWGEDMKAFHHNYVIEWPVSKSMADSGFTDAFREMAPVPRFSRGFTWSPRFDQSMQQRIDYLYYKGAIHCVNAFVKGYTDSEWPSDHAAIVAEYRFGKKPPKKEEDD